MPVQTYLRGTFLRRSCKSAQNETQLMLRRTMRPRGGSGAEAGDKTMHSLNLSARIDHWAVTVLATFAVLTPVSAFVWLVHGL